MDSSTLLAPSSHARHPREFFRRDARAAGRRAAHCPAARLPPRRRLTQPPRRPRQPDPAARERAFDVWLRARSSSTCPSSTSAVITAAASKYTRNYAVGVAKRGRKNSRRHRGHHAVDVGRANAHRDQREHVQTAMHHRLPAALKESASPPTATHGVASASSTQIMAPRGNDVLARPGRGTGRTSPAQRRAPPAPRSTRTAASCPSVRGFPRASAVGMRGSSAIPQIGHAPGRSRIICGCMGQVYSTFALAGIAFAGAAEPDAGEVAIPSLA